ncbi:helix-turn-helix transcriptional regulator [Streptomyces sp. NPDC018029]|uniref:helix-turn-helix transcriptional regulator n=1 Tax=Streptomyces sp. NPDC018029 TaxID=3365032 RepID=UPI003789EDCF
MTATATTATATTATATTATTGAAASAAPLAADLRRQELAAFLRSRRERVTPEQVGLPRGARRRTPGLRREEVAQLACVGVTWYTWLEQARSIKVSAQVIDAIARALLMDPSERAHLFALAGAVDPRPEAECTALSAEVRRLMRRLGPYPATVQNGRYDVLAYNRSWTHVFGDFDAMEPRDRNCLWLLATSRSWRETFLDRDEMLRDLVAKFRGAMAEHGAEPAWKELRDRLAGASAEFRELWERHEVATMAPHVKRYQHPRVGLLRLEHRMLWMAPLTQAYRLIAYIPADDATEERLERLAGLSGEGGTAA